MGDENMCHHYGSTTQWTEDSSAEDVESSADDEERWLPDAFEEDGDVEVELLTDGGDGAEGS